MAREKESNPKYPLYPLVRGWLEKIRLATDFKKSLFQDDADESMKFFHCGKDLHDIMFQRHKRYADISQDDEEDMPAPRFRVVVGKVAEIVELFGPSLYHRNPVCLVEPKNLDIPLDLLMKLTPPQLIQQAQQAAQAQGQSFNPSTLFPPDPEEAEAQIAGVLMQYYLNYIQFENDKKTHSRRMIDEALIKGMGVLWTEQFSPFEGGPELIGSFYDTIDNVVLDPDADHIDEIKWLARRCIHPVQDVAKEYGLDEEWLRKKFGTHESLSSQGESVVNDEHKRDRSIGRTNDLVEYWKVYSKMGMGHKLSGIKNLEDIDEFLDSLGQNCLIVVAKNVHFPLNLHTKHIRALAKVDDEDFDDAHSKTVERVSWPIPFWADGEWPCSFLAFHDVPNSPWPMPHIKPGLGYLKFINWTMSFLCNRMRTSCRTVVGVMKAAEEEFKQQLLNGKDFNVLEIPMSAGDDIRKLVSFLEIPQVNGDLWKVIEAVFDLFDKATGLTELAYAMPGGMRSAAEANQKSAAQNVRPDDMANKVEDTMSLVARKEAMAARWLLDRESVQPVLGRRGAALWEQYVMSGDILKVAREYNYRIEAGSMRKPNIDTEISNLMQALQVWAPFIQFCLANHMWDQVNALIEQYGKAFDFDVKKMLLPQNAPPPPNPMQQKIQAEIEKGKAELQIKQQESQIKQQGLQADIALKAQQHQMELQATQARAQAEAASAAMGMQVDQAKAQHDIQIERIRAGNDLAMQRMEMGQKMAAQQLGMLGNTLDHSLKMRMQHEMHRKKMETPNAPAVK